MRKTSIAGLDAGADDYLTKPVDHAALLARVRAMLRIKALHDTVQEQAPRLKRIGRAGFLEPRTGNPGGRRSSAKSSACNR